MIGTIIIIIVVDSCMNPVLNPRDNFDVISCNLTYGSGGCVN